MTPKFQFSTALFSFSEECCFEIVQSLGKKKGPLESVLLEHSYLTE